MAMSRSGLTVCTTGTLAAKSSALSAAVRGPSAGSTATGLCVIDDTCREF
jgi:hypothetical protein